MYLPAHFAQTDAQQLHELIRQHPLGVLTRSTPSGLDADHLPFELDVQADASAGERVRLLAHVPRDNPLSRDVQDGQPVLVVFRAEHAYVSPNWYPSKHETHRHVPTWNYRVVHAHGRVFLRHDRKFVLGMVGRLTREHESHTGDPQPWKVADTERSYLDQMLDRLVGVEIIVDRLEGKFKLGQNREARDREGAATALAERGYNELARAMRGAVPTRD